MSNVTVKSEESRYEIQARWPNKVSVPAPRTWDPNYTEDTFPGADVALQLAKTRSGSKGLSMRYGGDVQSSAPFKDAKRAWKIAKVVQECGFVDVCVREEKTSIVMHTL